MDYIWNGLATFAVELLGGAVPQDNAAITGLALPLISGIKDYVVGRYSHYKQTATEEELRSGIVDLKVRVDLLERIMAGVQIGGADTSPIDLDVPEDVRTRLESIASGTALTILTKSTKPLDIVKMAIAESKVNNIRLAEINPNAQVNKYLYLASDNYAGAIDTLNIAIHYNFLWRSYFTKKKKNGLHQSISIVQYIKEGDIIVLAYRQPKSKFKVLSPLVVSSRLDGMEVLKDTNNREINAFVKLENETLANMLQKNNEYGNDPKLKVLTGLPVKLLDTDFETDLAKEVYNSKWPSPKGINAIWRQNNEESKENKLPETISRWMDSLSSFQ